ncbi:MAG: hypothetical protein LBC45_04640 [Chlamydiales bacterium]|jgi:hypothetical protein|nr:hypothetical protein [Chlamydiales bacterium]
MSGITSVQSFQESKGANPIQDLNTFWHGRTFHKITSGVKYMIQSINRIAQSILSICIRAVSLGFCDLDSAKTYLFSNRLTTRFVPPPPPPMPLLPSQDALDRELSKESSVNSKHSSSHKDSSMSLQEKKKDIMNGDLLVDMQNSKLFQKIKSKQKSN